MTNRQYEHEGRLQQVNTPSNQPQVLYSANDTRALLNVYDAKSVQSEGNQVTDSQDSKAIKAGHGADTISASGPSVSMSGGSKVAFRTGDESVSGGSGIDHSVFVNNTSGSADVISGFKVGPDQIELYGYDSGEANPSSASGNTAIALKDGAQITLVGVSLLDGSSDFRA